MSEVVYALAIQSKPRRTQEWVLTLGVDGPWLVPTAEPKSRNVQVRSPSARSLGCPGPAVVAADPARRLTSPGPVQRAQVKLWANWNAETSCGFEHAYSVCIDRDSGLGHGRLVRPTAWRAGVVGWSVWLRLLRLAGRRPRQRQPTRQPQPPHSPQPLNARSTPKLTSQPDHFPKGLSLAGHSIDLVPPSQQARSLVLAGALSDRGSSWTC